MSNYTVEYSEFSDIAIRICLLYCNYRIIQLVGFWPKKSSWTILVHKRIAKWLAINSRQVEKTPSIVRFMKPQKASLGNDTLQVLKKQTK